MSLESLYIIGNGFDIHHGIPSRYSDFKEYLSNVDNDLHDLVEEYIPAQEDWSDLEAALAEIDIDDVIENASQFLVSYGAEDWSDAYHHDYQYEVSKVIEKLSVSLKMRFGEWVRQLVIPSTKELVIAPLDLPPTSRYLNFNYTSSLTDIYSILKNSIFYIHGDAQENDELVLGHAWNPVEFPSLNNVPDPELMDTRVMEGNEIINGYFGHTFKNSKKIIAENIDYFVSLRGVSKIIVLGHSLSLVDEAYFREIVKSIRVEVTQWVVTYYRDDEKEHHRAALSKMGVPDRMMNFCQLSEM